MTTFPNAIRTGGEVDAMCGRCEMVLAHTILAMVGPKIIKVRCNTCSNEHNFRGTQPLEKKSSSASVSKSSSVKKTATAKPRAAVVTISWDEQFAGKDISQAKKYSARETFKVDDVVDHPLFGLGLVRAVRGDKIEVGFKQEDKVLVHGKTPPPSTDSAAS